MNTPVTSTLDRASALVDRIDAELAEHAVHLDTTLGLVGDNPWCVTALGHRGIKVPA